MSTQDALRSALAELAALRAAEATLSAAYKAKQDAFAAENAQLIAGHKELSDGIAIHEQQVRALALTCYDLTGEKKPVEGAAVVIRTTYSYDADEALRWAAEHMPQLVSRKLDAKAFDKIAAAGGYSGATKIETPSVNISSDLSAFVAIPEPAPINVS